MKYRVGEVQNMTDGRDSHSGFNILNSHAGTRLGGRVIGIHRM
jgi:hypothetical protein